jgi:hypothetical protein
LHFEKATFGVILSGWPDAFVKKIAQNVAQTIFVKIKTHTTFTVEK